MKHERTDGNGEAVAKTENARASTVGVSGEHGIAKALSRAGNKARRALRLARVFFAQFLKRIVEYRVDFLTGAFAFFFGQLFNVLFIFLVFANITELDGWNLQQIIFIYGFSLIPRGIDHFYADNLWKVAYFLVRKGDFDKYMTRPIDPLHHVLLEGFEVDALGELLTGVVLVAVSASNIGLVLSPAKIILGLVAIAGGTLIYTGIKIIFASIALWTKRSGSILHMVYMSSDFVKYPVTIYDTAVRTVVTYIIPFAFTAYYPASYLLTGKDPLFCVGGAVVAGATLLAIGRIVWNRGIAAYESAGS